MLPSVNALLMVVDLEAAKGDIDASESAARHERCAPPTAGGELLGRPGLTAPAALPPHMPALAINPLLSPAAGRPQPVQRARKQSVATGGLGGDLSGLMACTRDAAVSQERCRQSRSPPGPPRNAMCRPSTCSRNERALRAALPAGGPARSAAGLQMLPAALRRHRSPLGRSVCRRHLPPPTTPNQLACPAGSDRGAATRDQGLFPAAGDRGQGCGCCAGAPRRGCGGRGRPVSPACRLSRFDPLQTMVRVKDPQASLDFYTRVLGMT